MDHVVYTRVDEQKVIVARVSRLFQLARGLQQKIDDAARQVDARPPGCSVRHSVASSSIPLERTYMTARV
jgi:hypothetical protein